MLFRCFETLPCLFLGALSVKISNICLIYLGKEILTQLYPNICSPFQHMGTQLSATAETSPLALNLLTTIWIVFTISCDALYMLVVMPIPCMWLLLGLLTRFSRPNCCIIWCSKTGFNILLKRCDMPFNIVMVNSFDKEVHSGSIMYLFERVRRS